MNSLAEARANILNNLHVDVREAALVGIREVLTEENTDLIIERIVGMVMSKLPWYARWIPLGSVLDKLLPEALLKVFEEFLA